MADRYLLETGAPDGYQLEDGSGVLLLEDEVAQPSHGWFSALSVAPKRRWAPQPELRAFGVTVAAAAVIATGWIQPLSKAVARPAVHAGSTFVPLDTRQVNTQTIDKWLVPLSVAVAVPPVWQGGASYEFRSTQFTQNTVYWGNYQQPLSTAVPRPPVWPGQSFVPFDTAQIIQNTVTIDKWQQPLSQAAPIPRYQAGNAFVPFNTAQINTQTIDKWLVPLSKAQPVPYAAPQGGLIWVGRSLDGNNVDISKWQQPLGKAAATPPVWQGATSVPYNTAQVIANTVTIDKWQQPFSTAVARPPVWAGNSFVPYNTAQVVAANVYGWWQPASVAPPPRPLIQSELRPFAAQQTVEVAVPYGWQQPLSKAAARQSKALAPRAIAIVYPLPDDQHIRWHQPLSVAVAIPRTAPQGFTSVPYNTVQAVVAAVYGWWQPLSRAVAIPYRTFTQGQTFVPYNTAQVIFNTIDYSLYMQPLSRAVPIPYRTFTQGLAFVPYNTAQVVAANYGWWPELSRAVTRPPVRHGGAFWVGQPLAGNNVDLGKWQQPLSRAAARLAPAWWGGPTYVFLSTQFTQNTVYWGNYQQPLSRPLARLPVQLGYSYVPFNTAQVQRARNYGYIVG